MVKMENYTDFAKVYDLFMDNVPYEQWGTLLRSELERFQVGKLPLEDENLKQEQNTVVDLGCGTGIMTGILADAGYDMIGIDLSEEMLEEARKRTGDKDILYLCQDMREFELFGTVGAVVCICDSLNYLTESEDVLQTFRLVNNYLFPGGVFLFDFNTVYKYRDVIGDTVIAENREEASFIWENSYYEEEQINECDLTLFIREGNGNSYRKCTETHVQRGYTPEAIRDLLEKAGLEFVEMRDSDTGEAVTEETERVFCIARECTKKL